MYHTVPLFTPAENENTTCDVVMEEIPAVTPVELSAIVHSGADAYAWANVSVTDVRRVPTMVIVPFRSLPLTVEVPPDTVGTGPDVIK